MTDVSSASATGFYDPFTMQWAGWAMTMLKIPRAALPDVVDTAGDHFTSTIPSIWGHPIRIVSCVSIFCYKLICYYCTDHEASTYKEEWPLLRLCIGIKNIGPAQ